jgi:hypothetical protein
MGRDHGEELSEDQNTHDMHIPCIDDTTGRGSVHYA